MRRIVWAFVGLFLANVCSGQEVPYTVADWPMEADLGSHRARIRVDGEADAVWVRIPWRRRDPSPETKAVIVADAGTGSRLTNVLPVQIGREYGDIVFRPVTAPGEYYVYYLPHRAPRRHMDAQSYTYLAPEDTADPGWLARNGLAEATQSAARLKSLPQAKVLEIQARTEFDRFDPMEVPATEQETEALLAEYPDRDWLLFPEDMKLTCSDLLNAEGHKIAGNEITCFNLEGTDWLG